MLKNDSYEAINEAIRMSVREGFRIAKFNISKNTTSAIFRLESNNIKNVFGYVSINKVNETNGICINIGYSMLDEDSKTYISSYGDVIKRTRLDAEHTDTIYVLYIPNATSEKATSKTEVIVLKHVEFRAFIETLRYLANNPRYSYSRIYKWITEDPSFLSE